MMDQATATRPLRFEEQDPFERLFFENYNRIYGLLYRMTGDRHEAEDLAQEVFWKFWKSPPVADQSHAGWLTRVAVRLGYNALRSSKRRLWYQDRAARLPERIPLSPADELARTEQKRRVRQVLARLSQRDAQLLILHHSGFSYRELAFALKLSPNSIGTLLSRAERAFEEIFAGRK